MKYLAMITAGLFACLWAGCSSAGQDVESTPVGSVLSGETKDADGYLDKVRQENAANTKRAAENQTDFESHERSNFFQSQERY